MPPRKLDLLARSVYRDCFGFTRRDFSRSAGSVCRGRPVRGKALNRIQIVARHGTHGPPSPPWGWTSGMFLGRPQAGGKCQWTAVVRLAGGRLSVLASVQKVCRSLPAVIRCVLLPSDWRNCHQRVVDSGLRRLVLPACRPAVAVTDALGPCLLARCGHPIVRPDWIPAKAQWEKWSSSLVLPQDERLIKTPCSAATSQEESGRLERTRTSDGPKAGAFTERCNGCYATNRKW